MSNVSLNFMLPGFRTLLTLNTSNFARFLLLRMTLVSKCFTSLLQHLKDTTHH